MGLFFIFLIFNFMELICGKGYPLEIIT